MSGRSVGGFAGIHGTYFCPPDYNWCGGQINRYDSPLFDSQEKKWQHWGKRGWDHRGVLIFAAGKASSYWPGSGAPEGGIDAGIMNYPMLTYQGNVVASNANTDVGQRNRGSRAGIGFGDGYLYLVQVDNATVVELARVMQALGAGDALNLDGGGTTALYYNGSYRVGPGRALPNAIVLVRE